MYNSLINNKKIFSAEISQCEESGMFSATDLIRAGNIWRMERGLDPFTLSTWLGSKSVKEFIQELEERYGKENVRKSSRGKGQHTWFHPLLFIDLALSISPKLKIEAYEWLYDSLIKNRNDSGDSYRRMCGELFHRVGCKTHFAKYICKVAGEIQKACGVEDWQRATEEQLKLRDKIHENIALLASVLTNPDEAVRIGILRATGQLRIG